MMFVNATRQEENIMNIAQQLIKAGFAPSLIADFKDKGIDLEHAYMLDDVTRAAKNAALEALDHYDTNDNLNTFSIPAYKQNGFAKSVANGIADTLDNEEAR